MRSFITSILCLFFTACMNQSSLPVLTIRSPEGDEARFYVEVADEPQERSQGLMNRPELPLNQGMLFVFDEQKPVSFWMKNTLIPLDIIFIDADGTVVAVETMQPCESDPCTTYPSGAPALYALEVNAGQARQYNIVAGSTVQFGEVLREIEQ